MNKVELTVQEYKEILSRLDAIDKKLAEKNSGMKERWIDNVELMNLLHISRRTAQTYRDENKLEFSIIGNKIFYKISSVEQMLERHFHKRLT